MKKFDHFKSNLKILEKADKEDLTNEFILGADTTIPLLIKYGGNSRNNFALTFIPLTSTILPISLSI